MKRIKLIIFFALTSSTLVSMQQRYPKRKQPESYPSIIDNKEALETALLTSYISRYGDKKLSKYAEEIQKYIYDLKDYDVICHKDIKQKVSHHLKECGMEHKKVLLVDDYASVEKPEFSDRDDIVVIALDQAEIEKNLDFSILHELGHLSHKHLLDIPKDKKHNHKQEFEADRFAQEYLLERKNYMPVIFDALYYLGKSPKDLLLDSFSHPCTLIRAQKELDSLHVHLALENKTIADMLEEEESLSSLDRILIKKTINQHFPSRYFH
jgi:hypothetical protein